MTVEAARQALFGDSLSSDDSRPAAVLPAVDDARRRALVARAEVLMRALALIEEARPDDDGEHGPVDAAVRRLESKVDLLVHLVGSLMQRDQPVDPPRLLRWSERGVAVELPSGDTPFIPAAPALFRMALSDALPEPLQLPATVLAVEPSPAGRRVWLQFDMLPPALESLLGRHLFRAHRRAVAESRRQR